MVAFVRHFGYLGSSGLALGRVHFDNVTVFSPSTQKASVSNRSTHWRAFSNGSVFGDRFRRCSVDDSRIRSKTAPFSFENGLVLVCTGP